MAVDRRMYVTYMYMRVFGCVYYIEYTMIYALEIRPHDYRAVEVEKFRVWSFVSRIYIYIYKFIARLHLY